MKFFSRIPKITPVEAGMLALAAAFLVFTVGYFAGQRGGGEPYTVSAQTLLSEEVGAGAKAPKTAEIEPVNINTADAGQLEALPGIGQVRARDIIADREANGPFRYPEEITRVSGIGQGTLAEILDYITVR